MTGREVIGLESLTEDARAYLSMEKSPVSSYVFDWPRPGEQLRIELQSPEDRRLKLYMDLIEGRRSSTVILGGERDRKATSQARAGSYPYARVDFADGPDVLRHWNPDGSLIVGSHIHLDLAGYGMRYAVPLNGQAIVVPKDGSYSFPSLFDALLDANHVSRGVTVNHLLEV